MHSLRNTITAVGLGLATAAMAVGPTATAHAAPIPPSTLSATGDAAGGVPAGNITANPLLDASAFGQINSVDGQFAGVTSTSVPLPIQFTGGPIAISPTNFQYTPVAGFLAIPVTASPPGAGDVIVDILAGGIATGSFLAGTGGGGTTTYSLTAPARFNEPNGFAPLAGTLNIVFTRSATGANVSEGWTLSLQKTDVPITVPEPASIALLGIGVIGLAALRRRRT